MMSQYRYYKKSWIFLEESKEKLLSKKESRALLKERGLIVRNTYDFDTKEDTSFWFIIKDKAEDISELPFSSRRNIRISLRKYNINKVDKDVIVQVGDKILTSAQKKRKVKSTPITKNDFMIMIDQYERESKIEYWTIENKTDGKVVGFSINRIKNDSCEYDTMSCTADSLQDRSYPYYGLIYTMNQYYLRKKGLKYVCDGSRTITEHSNIQDFLIHNFKFRKSYCKLKIHYKWWLGAVVKLVFPFRNIIPFGNIKAILKMEEYSRNSQ